MTATPGEQPDPLYPPLDPDQPMPADPGPLLPDTPDDLPPAPVEPDLPEPVIPPEGPEDPDGVPA